MSENKIENSYSSQMNDDLKKYMESINNIKPAKDNYNLNSFEKEVNELDKKYSIDNYNVRKVQSDLIEEIISAITRYLDISKVIGRIRQDANRTILKSSRSIIYPMSTLVQILIKTLRTQFKITCLIIYNLYINRTCR